MDDADLLAIILGSGAPAWAAGFDMWADYTTGQGNGYLAFPPGTDTHAQSIYALNSSGSYVSYPANVPVRTNLGLQTVPTRTNVCIRSQEFDNVAWAKLDVTVTADAVVAPDGTTTADLFTEGSANTALTASTAGTITGSAASAASIFLKRGNTDWIRIILAGPGAVNGGQVWVNLATGTVGTVSTRGAGTSFTATINTVAQGFYRLSLVGICSIETTVQILICSAAGDGVSTRVSGATYYVWGAQIEVGLFTTPYIPTTSTSVTVNGNQQVIGLTGRLGAGVAGFVQVNQLAPAVSGYLARIFELNDNGGSNFARLNDSGSGALQTNITTASVDQGTVGGAAGTFAIGLLTVAFAFGPNFNKFRLVGGADTTADTTVSWPTLTQIAIGGRGFDTSRNNYQQLKKLALKFGAVDQSVFNAVYAQAVIAARS